MKKWMALLITVALMLGTIPLFTACAKGEKRNEYRITAELEGNVLKGTTEFTFRNDEETSFTVLKFNLFGNAYREGAKYAPVPAAYVSAYYDGKDYGVMEIESVGPCAGWKVCGEDENILEVTLENELFPGESVSLEIGYTLTLAKVDHRTGITEHTINLGNFYPILCAYDEGRGFYECEYYADGDPFYSECADYTVTLTVPSEYTVAASGQTAEAKESGGKKTASYRLENARDFAIVCSTEFEVYQTIADGVQVMYYCYADAQAEKTLQLLADCITYYADTFGDYMYKTYSAVQTGFCFGGMEYPGLVMLSDALTEKDYYYTAAHETAHQWWYAAVGNNQLENAWMDEGLAEYSSYLFFAEREDYGVNADARKETAHTAYNALCSVQAQVFGEADTTMNRKLGSYGGYEYVVIAYDKGMLLFDTLRDAVGDQRFFAGLKRYYKEYSGKVAVPEELADCFRSAGAAGVIASFVDGSAVL